MPISLPTYENIPPLAVTRLALVAICASAFLGQAALRRDLDRATFVSLAEAILTAKVKDAEVDADASSVADLNAIDRAIAALPADAAIGVLDPDAFSSRFITVTIPALGDTARLEILNHDAELERFVATRFGRECHVPSSTYRYISAHEHGFSYAFILTNDASRPYGRECIPSNEWIVYIDLLRDNLHFRFNEGEHKLWLSSITTTRGWNDVSAETVAGKLYSAWRSSSLKVPLVEIDVSVRAAIRLLLILAAVQSILAAHQLSKPRSLPGAEDPSTRPSIGWIARSHRALGGLITAAATVVVMACPMVASAYLWKLNVLRGLGYRDDPILLSDFVIAGGVQALCAVFVVASLVCPTTDRAPTPQG